MTAVYAVVAKTARGRAQLATGLPRALPRTFPRDAWWCDVEAGVALHAPTVRAGGALAFAGTTTPRALASLRRDPVAALAAWQGDAAVIAWDGARLIAARDPLGQRGMFVREDADLHWICSELAPLMADPAFSCQLDLEAAFHYLLAARPPTGRTLAEGIARVPPAHVAIWRPGQPWLMQRCYTPLRETAQKVGDEALRGEIRGALDAAITRRLTRDRQALLLSGGVDSSYLAARGAALAGGDHFDAYTIEFAAPVRNEVAFARAVAERFGLRHHVVPLGLAETPPLIERVLAADEPCAAWAAVTHHHLLARVAGDGHRALWSGLGSDEVFGGYKHFLRAYLRWRRVQQRWGRDDVDAFDAQLWQRSALFAGNARFLDEPELARAFHPPFARWRDHGLLAEFYRGCRRIKRGAHWFEMAVAHECEHRIPDLLFANFEPIARAHGLRTSYPFLDLDVVPLACGLGATDRFENLGRRWLNKRLLREIAGAELPPLVMERKLASYSAPAVRWLSTPAIARPLIARLRGSKLWSLGLLRKAWLREVEGRLVGEVAAGKSGPACERMWALITLAAWYDRWVEGQR